MALTTVKSGLTVTVTADGSTAIDLKTLLGASGPIPLQGLSYYPAAGGNAVTVRDGGAAGGAVLWKVTSSAISNANLGDSLMFPGGKRCLPYIVGNEIANGDLIIFHLL